MELFDWILIGFGCLIPLVYCLLWRLVKLGIIGAALSFVIGYFIVPLGAIVVGLFSIIIIHYLIQKAQEHNRKKKAEDEEQLRQKYKKLGLEYPPNICQGDS